MSKHLNIDEQRIEPDTALLALEMGMPQNNYYLTKKQISFAGPLRVSQSILQKWLREEHGVHIHVGITEDGWITQNFDIDMQEDEENIKFDMYWSSKSYEEALEKGLFEALKLIGDGKD